VIRQFFPKGTDLREISEQEIKTVERHLNNQPIRKFDYLSPPFNPNGMALPQTLKYRAVALMT